jgi:hypothetical protein
VSASEATVPALRCEALGLEGVEPAVPLLVVSPGLRRQAGLEREDLAFVLASEIAELLLTPDTEHTGAAVDSPRLGLYFARLEVRPLGDRELPVVAALTLDEAPYLASGIYIETVHRIDARTWRARRPNA